VKLVFSRRIVEKYSTNFMKIHLMVAELFHVDGRRDITKLIVAFQNFEKTYKNGLSTKKRSDDANVNNKRTKGRQPDGSMVGEIRRRI
jgi:hypothetical protein